MHQVGGTGLGPGGAYHKLGVGERKSMDKTLKNAFLKENGLKEDEKQWPRGRMPLK